MKITLIVPSSIMLEVSHISLLLRRDKRVVFLPISQFRSNACCIYIFKQTLSVTPVLYFNLCAEHEFVCVSTFRYVVK